METKEKKYAELDKFLKDEINPDMLVEELTDLREQCIHIFMNVLIYEPNIRAEVGCRSFDYLYNLKRLIDIFRNIKIVDESNTMRTH
ncbi:MAG: hypothetical protein QM660_10775 [Dysgonomonas sp.]